jgi:glutamine cyclotransferase
MTYFLSRSLSIFLPILIALLGEVVVSSCPTSPDSSSNNASKNAISRVPKDSLDSTTTEVVPLYTYKIVNTYPHDRNAFTQGLVFEDGILYEGTGLHGQSTLRKVELETGDILRILTLPAQFFGEGVTIYGNKLIQLTWQFNVGFIYDKESFELLQEFNYSTEGWGITHDGKRLIMSDGTSTLHFLDPETFQEIGQIEVYDRNGPVTKLNELEYVQGEIYANIWKTDRVARIAPLTGQVMGWIELKNILSPEDRNHRVDALNGIAYDAKNDRLFVTGKFWPKIIEIKMISPDN